jgi:hypothetical protein
LVSGAVPIAELVLDATDDRTALDRLSDCIPMLERVFADWQQSGGASNFETIVAAASPRAATLFHSPGWPDSDGCCEPGIARHAVLRAIEDKRNTGVVVAGLSLLLGKKGRAQQRRDAVEIRRRGSVC